MLKKVVFALILALVFLDAFSQTGPAGVGTSANNVLWLKADAGTSSTINNTAISAWNDQSGNGINVSQTVSVQQPSFAANVINGFPAILFDNSSTGGQNDRMIGPDSPLLDNTSGYTFFHVTRPMNFGDARCIVSKRVNVGVDQSFMLFYYNLNKMNIDVQTNDNRFASNFTYTTATNYIGCLLYDGTISNSALRCTLYNGETFDRNGTEAASLVPDNASPLLIGTTDAGDNRPYGGYMSEIIIYRQALNDAQRIIVNNYLSAKYNIALTVNDKYAGDNTGSGDYDREVSGLGMEATGSSISFSPSISGGLGMSATSGLDVGDYVMVGHAVATNTTITTDVGGMTGSNRARWQRVWYVDATNTGAGIGLNVEFDMSDGGMAPFALGTLSNYVLLYRAGTSGNWLEVATASSISGDRIIFNSPGAAGDGYITLGTRDFHNSPLPVTLLEFKAELQNATVDLRWTTATEKNNDYFTLERSKDAETFEQITTVKGAGTSSVPRAYQYQDDQPYAGTSYYRLVQTDFDGKKNYPGLLSVNLKTKEEALLILPNPPSGGFTVKIPAAAEQQVRLNLYDATGKILVSDLPATAGADGSVLFPAYAMPGQGTYILKVSVGQKEYSTKLLIQ